MRQTTRPASSPSIQTYPYALDILLTLCFRSSGTTSSGITVGAVIPTAHALRQVGIPSGHPETSPTPTFRLADYTADRDSHPALKICRRKFITFLNNSHTNLLQFPTICNIFATLNQKVYHFCYSRRRPNAQDTKPRWRNR